jgi:hypothetical protein
MKTRNNFVSNSSSSSFIIAADPKQEEIEVTVKLKFYQPTWRPVKQSKRKLQYWIDRKITTTEQLNDWYEENLWDDDEDYTAKAEYPKAVAAIESGKYIYVGHPSNESDDTDCQLIYYHGFPNLKGAELIMFEGP